MYTAEETSIFEGLFVRSNSRQCRQFFNTIAVRIGWRRHQQFSFPPGIAAQLQGVFIFIFGALFQNFGPWARFYTRKIDMCNHDVLIWQQTSQRNWIDSDYIQKIISDKYNNL